MEQKFSFLSQVSLTLCLSLAPLGSSVLTCPAGWQQGWVFARAKPATPPSLALKRKNSFEKVIFQLENPPVGKDLCRPMAFFILQKQRMLVKNHMQTCTVYVVYSLEQGLSCWKNNMMENVMGG